MSTINATDNPIATPESSSAQGGAASRHGARRYLAGAAPEIGFFLFVLVNCALFIRPMDVFPRLKSWPIYEILIGASLVISFRAVFEQLTRRSLAERPITVCVLGLLGAVLMSHLSRLNVPAAFQSGLEFSKLVAYYFLLVGVVDTPRRLQWFLRCLAVFACIQIGMAVLQHYGVIDLPALRPVEEQAVAQAHGEIITQYRICGAGIFHDTNDLSVLIAMTIPLCLYLLTDRSGGSGSGRWVRTVLCAAAIGLCGDAMMLTQSRGGIIAMMGGLAIFFFVRFGWKCIVLALLLPLLPRIFVGRQTDIHMLRRSTAQSRLGYWAEGFNLFAKSPIFGVGQGNFIHSVGNVAHNSFVHCFTELGFFGGTFFLGAFYLAFWPIYRLPVDHPGAGTGDGELRRLRPYFLAMVAAWATGMFSLSRSYVTPTYMIPGLATVYFGLMVPGTSSRRLRVDGRLAMRLMGLSLVFLAGVYLFVKLFYKG